MVFEARGQLKRDYFWNTASSLIGSAAMVLMLLAVSRTAGVYAAGLYALATAVGQQFQTLGSFEVRPYQATDVRDRFSFGSYLALRIVTVTLMAAAIVVFVLFTAQPGQNVLILILVASLRLFDAFEDVFYGELQRIGRLDLAGRANFFRVLITLISFIAGLYLTNDLLVTTLVTLAASLLAMVGLVLLPARRFFSLKPSFDWRPIQMLAAACAPLFVGAFLAMYLANAPKFSIEQLLDGEAQGYYNIIFMPALAINIMAMFFFRPLMTRMALLWNKHERVAFKRVVARGMQGVAVAFLVTALVTYYFGIPILGWLYAVDLSGLQAALMVLVLGGALNAVSVILYYALTTIRRQHAILVGYALAAFIAWIASDWLTKAYGLFGAAEAYAVTMGMLVVFLSVALAWGARGNRDGGVTNAKK